ncbi:general stress protein 16O [mine drainage metagenome]|uniref:General stress protein 16O n=1 Tax=mine drainage metagenome TaxID=410659 RepID=A0A1J5U321_9ZZZZ
MAKKKTIPAKRSASPKKHEPSHTGKKSKAIVPTRKTPSSGDSKPESKSAPSSAKLSARETLRSRVLARAKVTRPIAFSLEEAREIAKSAAPKPTEVRDDSKAASKNHANGRKELGSEPKAAQPNHIKAASLADILGFNPRKKANPTVENEEDIPERFRRFYKLLIDLRDHVTGQLDQHTEETLKRSAKDDAGDLSSYGQHMADAGTDTFDRDFALSLVSNEQEALSEIDAAIQRIKSGTYGICEVTGKPIAKERLLAVPFTRYSAEAQKEIEKNRYRARQQAGLFGELGEEGAKIADDDSGED